MSIDAGKVLTIRARDYVETQSKRLKDYRPFGVCLDTSVMPGKANVQLGERAPEGTEVITDAVYAPVGSDGALFVSGTALIPKELKER